MSLFQQVTRRSALACQAAFLGLAAAPQAASALGRASQSCAAPAQDAVTHCLPARWTSATATELADFIGDRFRVTSERHGTVVLKLVALEPHASGPARPGQLPRREGVTALFESPDMGPLVAEQSGTYRVSHPRIGSADLYLSAAPRRDGRAYVELVLN
ncbi:DUF6916 family protein [Tropicibacter oceani]|uniref:DUF6916 domain-containing protein n=1 Tax=Tropicibacter oceani TaxID=3058420 RepID=A0ABY8QED7_9RHOB|nr:hypothetical protein [Tropicibacter oceani]WGW02974.1 hypothetical protein QF118_13665 [Tropicibacter oceani]